MGKGFEGGPRAIVARLERFKRRDDLCVGQEDMGTNATATPILC